MISSAPDLAAPYLPIGGDRATPERASGREVGRSSKPMTRSSYRSGRAALPRSRPRGHRYAACSGVQSCCSMTRFSSTRTSCTASAVVMAAPSFHNFANWASPSSALSARQRSTAVWTIGFETSGEVAAQCDEQDVWRTRDGRGRQAPGRRVGRARRGCADRRSRRTGRRRARKSRAHASSTVVPGHSSEARERHCGHVFHACGAPSFQRFGGTVGVPDRGLVLRPRRPARTGSGLGECHFRVDRRGCGSLRPTRCRLRRDRLRRAHRRRDSGR